MPIKYSLVLCYNSAVHVIADILRAIKEIRMMLSVLFISVRRHDLLQV